MIDKSLVKELAEERIEELNINLYIVDISISSTNRIQVEIDSMDGGVSIESCQSVSRNIEHNLDREVEDFSLEVSSPGLDKPFKVRNQYLKNVGKEIDVKKDHGKVIGILKEVNDDGIVLLTSRKERLEGRKKKVLVEEEVALGFDDIKEAKIVISFK